MKELLNKKAIHHFKKKNTFDAHISMERTFPFMIGLHREPRPRDIHSSMQSMFSKKKLYGLKLNS